MSLRINSTAPDFDADTTHGRINFHDWIGDGWAVLFSHPKDFTPVCTSELGHIARLQPQFAARRTKLIGLSVDVLSAHDQWAKDIEALHGYPVSFPLISDPDLKVAALYDMLPEAGPAGPETDFVDDNATVRSLFVIGPDKKVKASLTYPVSTGRNFDEILRLLDSCQLTERFQVATPANWHHGEDVIILPELPDEDAQKHFPDGWRAPLPYVRLVPDPSFGEDWFSTLERH